MRSPLEEWVEICTSEAPVLREFGTGQISDEQIQAWTRRHYAEVRTFIDIKLPERIRICPHEAYAAKQFFAHIYEEEQGNFIPGGNHAQMFAKFAHAIGIEQAELEEEFKSYAPRFDYMRELEVSEENLVRELAISYAWESAINRIARALNETLSDVIARNGLSADAVEYFTAHIELDESHAREALETLEKYVTSPGLEEVARAAIRETLVDRNPWT